MENKKEGILDKTLIVKKEFEIDIYIPILGREEKKVFTKNTLINSKETMEAILRKNNKISWLFEHLTEYDQNSQYNTTVFEIDYFEAGCWRTSIVEDDEYSFNHIHEEKKGRYWIDDSYTQKVTSMAKLKKPVVWLTGPGDDTATEISLKPNGDMDFEEINTVVKEKLYNLIYHKLRYKDDETERNSTFKVDFKMRIHKAKKEDK